MDRRVLQLLIDNKLRLLEEIPGERYRLGRSLVAIEVFLGLVERIAPHNRVALLFVGVTFVRKEVREHHERDLGLRLVRATGSPVMG